MNYPEELQAVLADITHQNSLGKNCWFEIVYYSEGEWKSYHGSNTFESGESVIRWRYVNSWFAEPAE